MEGIVSLIDSKHMFTWMDDKVQFHFEIQHENADSLGGFITAIDSQLRDLVSNSAVEELSDGRDDALITAFLKNFDLSKAFSKTEVKEKSLKTVVYTEAILNIFPIAFFFARF